MLIHIYSNSEFNLSPSFFTANTALCAQAVQWTTPGSEVYVTEDVSFIRIRVLDVLAAKTQL